MRIKTTIKTWEWCSEIRLMFKLLKFGSSLPAITRIAVLYLRNNEKNIVTLVIEKSNLISFEAISHQDNWRMLLKIVFFDK